jgi:deferrochelatase/peroxidase EfeB
MTFEIDLADIQGNILAPYGKLGFPTGRNILLRIGERGAPGDTRTQGERGRHFLTELLPYVTTALPWRGSKKIRGASAEAQVDRPKVTLNIAFNFLGLIALEVPTRTLRGLPDAFIDGMTKRARILGDDFNGQQERWDAAWKGSGFDQDRFADPKLPHILITLNVLKGEESELDPLTKTIEDLARENGVVVVTGHDRAGDARYQELSALRGPDGRYLQTEHFGFFDGIGDPVFEGQYEFEDDTLGPIGNGAMDGDGNWRPLKAGEFLLGYPDEAQETSGIYMPLSFARNGTFLAYRKIYQNVPAWRDFIARTAVDFGKVFKIDDPANAQELLKAKMAGRWSDGIPLSIAPTPAEWHAKRKELFPQDGDDDATKKAKIAKAARAFVDFRYLDDPSGVKCPMGSHLRRVNTRDSLDPDAPFYETLKAIDPKTAPPLKGSVLNNRRRILRRGLPYGQDSEDVGIVMLVMCADLFRQFEFVQQQWINYGLDARAGNDVCPIVGNHLKGDEGQGPAAKFVIPAPEGGGHPPFIVDGIPQFVEVRGGDYFFVPSLTALRMIGMGTIDPT